MSSLMVRWATRWDRSAVIALSAALAAQQGRVEDEDNLVAGYDYALATPTRVRFAVAQEGDEVVGVASLHEAFSTTAGQMYGRIEDLFVRPDKRLSGVGTALVELLASEAKRRGYYRLQITVPEDDDPAWKFCEARGYHFTGQLVYALELVDQEINNPR